jgi:hypothetical protein
MDNLNRFWNLFKRGAKVTHMAPKHNQPLRRRASLHVQNEREISDAERMREAVAGVVDRQSTYAELTSNS